MRICAILLPTPTRSGAALNFQAQKDPRSGHTPPMKEKSELPLPGPTSARSAIARRIPRPLWARRFLAVTATLSVVLLWNLVGEDLLDLFKEEVPRHHHSRPCFRKHPDAWPLRAFRKHNKMKTEEAEKLFLSIPSPSSVQATSTEFASAPHLGGSTIDHDQAKRMLQIFQQELGISPPEVYPEFDAGSEESRNATLLITQLDQPAAWIDTYYPILNTPLTRELQILGDDDSPIWNADVEEVENNLDPAGKFAKTIGAWHGLSKEGDVTGKLVYVNYGSKEDYDELRAQGVDLNGTITIARYGGLFRGLKVKAAQEAGAIGALVYSDPRDDGTVTIENGYKPYPEGPARNPDSVQRGSVQFLSLYPGDPSTPGYPSYPNATRSSSGNTPSIPSLPISWTNAKRLLLEIDPQLRFMLNGERSKRSIRLRNSVDTKVTPIWNTMAVIPGHVKSEVVILGNHRDAWVLGADVAAKGPRFRVGGSPTLAHLLKGVAEELPHPTESGRTLWDARHDAGTLNGPSYGRQSVFKTLGLDWKHEEMRMKEMKSANSTGVFALGSGSDYTVFLQRIGIASSDEGFGSTYTDPVYHYHSVYDSLRFQELYSDPGFHRHVSVAQHIGLVALRLINTPLLPLNTTQYALELGSYLEKVKKEAAAAGLHNSFHHLANRIEHLQTASHHLDHAKTKAAHELEKALEELEKHRKQHGQGHRRLSAHHPHHCTGQQWRRTRDWIKSVFGVQSASNPEGTCKLHRQISDSQDGDSHLPAPVRRVMHAARVVVAINKKLSSFERGFIDKEGIKDREWYRNIVVAPGKWKGYGATTFPALSEAIETKDSKLVHHEIGRLSHLVHKLAQHLHV
ncbi:hypothetical protein FRC02_010413 [Tulasnella sp. 418]|nr:hypothetical protein FRC02_010413 [Tulasnella sp. 418]